MANLTRTISALVLAAFAVTATALAMSPSKTARIQAKSQRTIWLTGSELVTQALAAMEQGNSARAAKLGLRALGLDLLPGDKITSLNILCVAHTHLREYKKALRNCNRVIHYSGPDWRFYNNRANAYLQSGEIDRALADYRQAHQLAQAEERADEAVKAITAGAAPSGGDQTATPDMDIIVATVMMKPSEVLRRNIELAENRKQQGLAGIRVGLDNPNPQK